MKKIQATPKTLPRDIFDYSLDTTLGDIREERLQHYKKEIKRLREKSGISIDEINQATGYKDCTVIENPDYPYAAPPEKLKKFFEVTRCTHKEIKHLTKLYTAYCALDSTVTGLSIAICDIPRNPDEIHSRRSFGLWLMGLRIKQNMTRLQLDSKTRIHIEDITRYESGVSLPSSKFLVSLLKVLLPHEKDVYKIKNIQEGLRSWSYHSPTNPSVSDSADKPPSFMVESRSIINTYKAHLIEARTDKDWSMSRVARALGVSKQFIEQCENPNTPSHVYGYDQKQLEKFITSLQLEPQTADTLRSLEKQVQSIRQARKKARVKFAGKSVEDLPHNIEAVSTPTELGGYLRYLRVEKGLSRKDLAESAKLSPSQIMTIERNKSSVIQASHVAQAFESLLQDDKVQMQAIRQKIDTLSSKPRYVPSVRLTKKEKTQLQINDALRRAR